ncbi:fructuronate reductase [Motilibacter rhizosphaerae]|uniref:Mannitol-1-phosphate 5-dehydrogenase n=1 Tax=Motilibacter rhizosphaerae TaxID=598652 RepID=A0A4Q7NSU4_9ACTN|nr:mannitol dehydrogenase family protein [Motilibacter rhizosphaerae]RZS89858.1 fructuronate reductase [Motilibacter rhizosphaerae]
MAPRLSLRTLPDVADASAPPLDPSALEVGIMHLGIGAFHRAHQAEFTQDAMAASGDTSWGICGVTQRSRSVLDDLEPQDGLSSVLVRSGSDESLRVNAAVRELRFALDTPDALVARLADPKVRVVTLTVTEKGYRHDPATRRLRTDDAEVAADAAGRPPRTVVGQLVRGLAARRSADAGSVSLLPCDNLPANGKVLAGLVSDFCGLLGDPALAAWVEENVAFPSSMVDRIVPATTDADRSTAERMLGLRDEGVVATEPFRQWVVEDVFAAGRPSWELAGAVLTDDVTPYEAMKLRLLNGSHSTLAYLGALAGREHISDAVADPALAEAVSRMMRDEVTPTLAVPDGFDLPAYEQDLLRRFANPALRHRTLQVAMDGSQKLPQRLVAVARERLATGAQPRLSCLGIAGWMRWVTAGTTEDGRPIVVDDPLADQLAAATAGATTPAVVVDGLLGIRAVFGDDLGVDPEFRSLVLDSLQALTSSGVAVAVREALR